MHEFKGIVDAYSAALAATRAECGYIILCNHVCAFLFVPVGACVGSG